jgi:hypothetical protein
MASRGMCPERIERGRGSWSRLGRATAMGDVDEPGTGVQRLCQYPGASERQQVEHEISHDGGAQTRADEREH